MLLETFQPGHRIGAHVQLVEDALVGRVRLRRFKVDLAFLLEAMKILFKKKGMGRRLLHPDTDTVRVARDDGVANRFDVAEHNFHGGEASAVLSRDETLTDDALETVPKLELYEVPLYRVEKADDAIHDFARTVRMEGA